MNHACLTWYYKSLKLSMIHRTKRNCSLKLKVDIDGYVGYHHMVQDWISNHISLMVTPNAYITTADIGEEQMERCGKSDVANSF